MAAAPPRPSSEKDLHRITRRPRRYAAAGRVAAANPPPKTSESAKSVSWAPAAAPEEHTLEGYAFGDAALGADGPAFADDADFGDALFGSAFADDSQVLSLDAAPAPA